MPIKKEKEEFTQEIFDKFVEILLGYPTLEEAVGKMFTKKNLEENHALEKYLELDFGNLLQKTLLHNECGPLRIKREDLTENNLINILRTLIRNRSKLQLYLSWDTKNKIRRYTINV